MYEEILNKQRKSDKPYVILHIEGGAGKGVCATAVLEAVSKKYPNHYLIVVTAWEEVWYHNPLVHRVYNFNQLTYFYNDFIFDDTVILRIDPYHSESHIKGKKHLIQSWCDVFDVPYNNEAPKIYLTEREKEVMRDKLYGGGDNRPIFLLQTNGGVPTQHNGGKSWARDLPLEIALPVVQHMAKTHRVIHVRREDQPVIDGIEWTQGFTQRDLMALLTLSDKRLFIDSFMQHLAATLGLKSTVVWVANKPKVYGYKLHNNLQPSAEVVSEFTKYSYMDKTDISGKPVEFPYDTTNIFDPKDIIKALTN
jgi:hypothetical protein